MSKKISQEQVQQIISFYSELGTYSAVAKKVGISATTVSRYVKEALSEKSYTSYSGPNPSFPNVLHFDLASEEKSSYNAFLEEFA